MNEGNSCTEYEDHHGASTSKIFQKDKSNSKPKNYRIVITMPIYQCTLTNKMPELKALIEEHKPSIIAITEVTPKNIDFQYRKQKSKSLMNMKFSQNVSQIKGEV